MTNQITTNQITKIPADRGKASTMQLMADPRLKEQMRAVLPTYLTPERMIRIALTEIRANPKLAECDPRTFVGSVIRCAQMGLEPSTEKGHAFLVPFWNGKTKRSECKAILGYKGMIHLAAKSGIHCEPGVVYGEDFFEMEHGLEPKLKHRPNLEKRGEFKGVYVIYRFSNNPSILPRFAYMSKAELEEAKAEALKDCKYPALSAWTTNTIPMYIKTLIRRSVKYCPMSDELQYAVSSDEQAEIGIQDNAALADMFIEEPVQAAPAIEHYEEPPVEVSIAPTILLHGSGTIEKRIVAKDELFSVMHLLQEEIDSPEAFANYKTWAQTNYRVYKDALPEDQKKALDKEFFNKRDIYEPKPIADSARVSV